MIIPPRMSSEGICQEAAPSPLAHCTVPLNQEGIPMLRNRRVGSSVPAKARAKISEAL